MKKYLLLFISIISYTFIIPIYAQVIPIVEVRINSTPTAKDDYVNSEYIPCTIRLFNGESFTNNLPVTLRNIPFSSGGQVLLSATGGSSPGSISLDLNINRNNSFLTFYIKARPGYTSLQDKDAIIEVVDNRAVNNAIILARKAFMVGAANPLPASIPKIEIQINSVSSMDDYITWSPTPCSIRLTNHESFSSPVNVTINNMSGSVGKINFAGSDLQNNSTASTATLNLSLPNSGTWVNFFISGKFNNPSQRDKDAILEVLTAGTQTVLVKDTVLYQGGSRVERDTVILTRDTLISETAVRSSQINGTDTITSIKGTVIKVRDTIITARRISTPGGINVIEREEIIANGTILTREPLMVRVRKNANNYSIEERQRFLNSLTTLNNTFNGYLNFINIHVKASSPEAHDGPAFLAWHRAYILDMERKLQSIDPSVSLPYWKFDTPAPNVFSMDFMGSKPVAGDSFADFNASDPLTAWSIPAGTGIRRTTAFADNEAPILRSETATLALGTSYSLFRRLETNPHGHAHNLSASLTGDWLKSISTSVNDPLFFFLHSNIDRLWAKWQWINSRFDATNELTYSPQGSFPNSGTIHIGHYLNDTMWPWNGVTGTYNGSGTILIGNRPTSAPGGPLFSALSISSPVNTPQPFSMIDYKNNRLVNTTNSGMGFCYDDVPFQ